MPEISVKKVISNGVLCDHFHSFGKFQGLFCIAFPMLVSKISRLLSGRPVKKVISNVVLCDHYHSFGKFKDFFVLHFQCSFSRFLGFYQVVRYLQPMCTGQTCYFRTKTVKSEFVGGGRTCQLCIC